MSTGYDEDGVKDLICSAPPDAGVDGGGPAPNPCEVDSVSLGSFKPNCFTGITFPTAATYPQYDFGLVDFSLEYWRRWSVGMNGSGAGTMNGPGLSNETNVDVVYSISNIMMMGGWFTDVNYQVYGRIRLSPGGGGIEVDFASGGPPVFELASEWVHWVVNIDRNANATFYRNGEVFDTPGNLIPGVLLDMGVCRIYPPSSSLTRDNWNAGGLRNFDGDGEVYPLDLVAGGVDLCHTFWGPWAFHSRLLTAAEMMESYRGRYVQDLGAATIQLVDPAEVFGHTAWDCCPNRMVHGIRSLIDLQGHEIGAPVGTNGTVFMRDLSGNTRHVPLRTRTQYASASVSVNAADDPTGATDCRATVGFAADPTWI